MYYFQIGTKSCLISLLRVVYVPFFIALSTATILAHKKYKYSEQYCAIVLRCCHTISTTKAIRRFVIMSYSLPSLMMIA